MKIAKSHLLRACKGVSHHHLNFGRASKARGGDALEWREVRLQVCPDWRVLLGDIAGRLTGSRVSSLIVWRASLAFIGWS